MSLVLAALFFGAGVVAALGLAAAWWRAQRGRHTGAKAGLSVVVVLVVIASQAAMICGAGVLVNRSMVIYASWDELWASLSKGDEGELLPRNEPLKLNPAQTQELAASGYAPFTTQPPQGDGEYRVYLVPSPSNHTKKPVVVWVPPGFEKAKTFAGLKVVYLYNAAYGSVAWFITSMKPGTSAAGMIREKKIQPFLIVAPEINIDAPADTECTDYPHEGPQAYTWLAKDVPTWAHDVLKVPGGAKNTSAAGWSVGGYCAAKLHAALPDQFGAAASLQGFFTVENDNSTGALTHDLATTPGLRERTDVGWLLNTVSRTDPLHLLVLTSKVDPQSYPSSAAFLRDYGALPGIFPAVAEQQGHNLRAFDALQPELWRFLVLRTDWPKNLTAP